MFQIDIGLKPGPFSGRRPCKAATRLQHAVALDDTCTTLSSNVNLNTSPIAGSCYDRPRAGARKEVHSMQMAGRLAAAAVLLMASAAGAAVTPEQKCQAGKEQTAGKFAACLAKSQAKFVATQDADAYAAAVAACEGKSAAAWTKLEAAAAAKGATCPSSGDSEAVADFLHVCAACVATAAGGGDACADPYACADDAALCADDLETCQADLAACEAEPDIELTVSGQTQCWNAAGGSVPCAGTGQDGESRLGRPFSFTNNGDGTITDHRTGLMWEVLSDDGSIHDWNNTYNWNDAFLRIQSLNSSSFAGYDDWRVPNVRELQSLVDFGRTPPMIDPVFHTGCTPGCSVTSCSCTASVQYWSSTSIAFQPTFNWAWYVYFSTGATDGHGGNKGVTHRVRAVRGGE